MASGNSEQEWARVKADLARKLKHNPALMTWNHLCIRGWVGRVAVGKASLNTLLNEYEQLEDFRARLLAVRRTRADKHSEDSPRSDHRAIALSQVLATLADREPDVQAFRRDVLHGELLDWQAVGEWIRERSATDAATETQTFTLRGDDLPPIALADGLNPSAWFDAAVDAVRRGGARVTAVGVSLTMLSYYDPGAAGDSSEWPHVLAVAEGSDLWRLREVALEVAKPFETCGWSEPWAVHFVLSGLTPPVVTLGVTQEFGSWGARVCVCADPRVSPDEVADAYRTARAKHRSGPNQPMEQKNAEMAAFLARFYKAESRPWKELRALWNKANPGWPIDDDSRFIRDATAAWKRVTGGRFAFAETVQDKEGTP